ncbi:MAG TPA: hypothetical protein VF867_00170 [Arthrobacter sp.]
MGLDQALRRMSPETYRRIQEWEAGDHEADYPDVHVEELWVGRKENHIHCYFEGEVGDVENCAYLRVEREHIERLVDRLAKVHADHELAGALLPTQAGFFFGSTDFDEWYFKDVEAELKEFTEILEHWDPYEIHVYWAWW